MARLFLVRHASIQSERNARCWGHSDVALNDEGLLQARKLSERLAGEKVSRIYASDLRRARVTAEAIAEAHRVPVTSCPELREVHFGQCEGLTYDEIVARYPEVAAIWSTGSHAHDMQFPGGESVADVANRVGRFNSQLSGMAQDDTALIVAHGGSLRVLICCLLGLDLSHNWQFHIEPASLTVLHTYPEGVILTKLNDMAHLSSAGD